MKLARFSKGDAPPALGLVLDQGMVDLTRRLEGAPSCTIDLITRWDELRAGVEAQTAGPADYALADVRLLAPVPRPGKVLAIGLNYADHVEETGLPVPEDQLWFSKMPTAIRGTSDDIELPIVSPMLDYEAELVFVIGKRCRHVSRARAIEAIFGYCVGNDLSVRDWQSRTSQFMLGKSFDSHAPFGPWIVTADELDVGELGIRSFVNGELRQNSNTRHLIFDCLAQVEHLTKAMTLEPGDVIFTGTPAGVAAGFDPPRWLREGDLVRIEVDGIGAIENRVAAEQPPSW